MRLLHRFSLLRVGEEGAKLFMESKPRFIVDVEIDENQMKAADRPTGAAF